MTAMPATKELLVRAIVATIVGEPCGQDSPRDRAFRQVRKTLLATCFVVMALIMALGRYA